MFVPTRSSQLKLLTADSCKTVVYRSKTNGIINSKSDDDEPVEKSVVKREVKTRKKEKDQKWNMKKLRYDIIKFGTTGFRGAKKEESKIAIAVSLGAEPPKNKYINYKDLVKIKSAEKMEAVKFKKSKKNKKFKTNKLKVSNQNKRGHKT